MILQWLTDLRQFFHQNGDPRVDHWFLVHEPLYIVALTIVYLFIVIFGPKWMKNKKALELRKPLIAYNFFLVVLSAWMLKEFICTSVLNPAYDFWCQPPVITDNSEIQARQLNASWWYFFSKIIEFMDTFFFILRKKDRQITFLHVYHHTTVLSMQWMSVKLAPGAAGCFAAMFNCFIHVLMYGYYMLAAFGPHMQKYLWWKRYLTTMQISQFFVVFLHTSYAIKLDCGYPKGLAWMLWLYMVTLFMLFSHFYKQAYSIKKQETKLD